MSRVWVVFLEVACTGTGGGEKGEEGAGWVGGQQLQEGAGLLGGEQGAERLDCQVWPASTLLQQLFHCHSTLFTTILMWRTDKVTCRKEEGWGWVQVVNKCLFCQTTNQDTFFTRGSPRCQRGLLSFSTTLLARLWLHTGAGGASDF